MCLKTVSMTLDQFNFGQLLHLLNDEHLKYKIRCIEKVNKRIANIKSDIKFNNTCISEGVYPNYTNTIYIYIRIFCFRTLADRQLRQEVLK